MTVDGSDIACAIETVDRAVAGLQALRSCMVDGVRQAIERLHACRGRVIVSGMGKAGLVAMKISATLASTGTPSFAMHPGDALHGDLGRVCADDVVILLSKSGETEETNQLAMQLKSVGVEMIAMTQARQSTLARLAGVLVCMPDSLESPPLTAAPTTSTTAMIVAGDAIAMGLAMRRGFTSRDFQRMHPGGAIGRAGRRIREMIDPGAELATICMEATIADAVVTMMRHRAGAVVIVDSDRKLKGIFTDGDLRRMVLGKTYDLAAEIADWMTPSPYTIRDDMTVADAGAMIRAQRVDEIVVVDANQHPVGLLDVQDFIRAILPEPSQES